MPEIFISHAEEDFPLMQRLANGLEGSGYKTWYYERDTVPGPSYIDQCVKAIDQCPALLVLISSQSVDSNEVAMELHVAHQKRRVFLPVLVDCSASMSAKTRDSDQTRLEVAKDRVHHLMFA